MVILEAKNLKKMDVGGLSGELSSKNFEIISDLKPLAIIFLTFFFSTDNFHDSVQTN